MKYIFFTLVYFTLVHVAHAGSANCTGITTTLTAPQTYGAQGSDCIIRTSVPLASMGYVRVTLPASPSVNDEFTLQENSDQVTESGSYWDEEYEEWVPYSYSYTGGTSLYSSGYEINDANLGPVWEAVTYSKGRQFKVIFDGEYWQLTESAF